MNITQTYGPSTEGITATLFLAVPLTAALQTYLDQEIEWHCHHMIPLSHGALFKKTIFHGKPYLAISLPVKGIDLPSLIEQQKHYLDELATLFPLYGWSDASWVLFSQLLLE